MSDILRTAGIILAGTFSISCLLLAYRLLRGDPLAYERNRERTGSWNWLRALRGEVPTRFDDTRDARVAAGIAIDRATNEWVEQGRLSAEAISAVLRRKPS